MGTPFSLGKVTLEVREGIEGCLVGREELDFLSKDTEGTGVVSESNLNAEHPVPHVSMRSLWRLLWGPFVLS